MKNKAGFYKIIPIGLLSLACIGLGNFYIPIFNIFTEKTINYISPFVVGEWLVFALKTAVAYITYKTIISKDYKIIKILRRTNISFSSTNFLFVLFLTIMILWKL